MAKPTRPCRRPCRICKRWFTLNSKVDDQKTCGDLRCKKAWHTKKCAEWNKNNKATFKANYLTKKLNYIAETSTMPNKIDNLVKPIEIPPSRLNLDLPRKEIQEVIGWQQLIIIEYIVQQLQNHF